GVMGGAGGVRGIQETGDHGATGYVQCVGAAGFGKVPIISELPAIKVHDRDAGYHQRVRLRHVLESERLEDVVVLDERHAGGAVMEAIVRHVECSVFDALPCVADAGVLEILFQREVQFEIERVPVTANTAWVGMVDGFLYMRQENRRIGIEDFAVAEDITLSAIEELSRILAVDRAIEEVEHEPLDMLRGIDAEPVNADDLYQPLRVAHEVSHRILNDRISGGGVFDIEAVYRNATLIRSGIKHKNRVVADLRVEAAVGRIGHIRQPPETRRRSGGYVLSVARSYWVADELVILFLGDVDQPGEPSLDIASCECGVEVAVNVVRQCN